MPKIHVSSVEILRYYQVVLNFYNQNTLKAEELSEKFKQLRTGGVAAHLSMIYALLLQEHIQKCWTLSSINMELVKNTNFLLKGLSRIFEEDLLTDKLIFKSSFASLS